MLDQENFKARQSARQSEDKPYDPEVQVINFPKGLYGFPSSKTFALVPLENPKYKGFSQLHNLEEPGLSFLLFTINPAKTSWFSKEDLLKLIKTVGIKENNCEMFAITTLEKDEKGQVDFTINLLAPLVMDSHSKVGYQYIIEGGNYKTNQRLSVASI